MAPVTFETREALEIKGVGMDIIGDMTMERDRMEWSLGDTLDVKAGVVFAAIAVLGTLTGTLLASSALGKEGQLAQMLSLACLAVAALFSVMTMVPRDYLLPDTPDKYKQWIDGLREYYKDNPDELEAKTIEGLTKVATERITANHDINSAKSGYLALSFWMTIAALTIDIVTLAAIGLSKLLS